MKKDTLSFFNCKMESSPNIEPTPNNADHIVDLPYEQKINCSQLTKGTGPFDAVVAVKGFMKPRNRAMSQQNNRRKGQTVRIEGTAGHRKTSSTSATLYISNRSRTWRTRRPSITDLTSQQTNRFMYGNTFASSATMRFADNLKELQKEFPVLPYYKDESQNDVAIPLSLQVKESVWTLKYHRIKSEDDSGANKSEDTIGDEGALKLEQLFIQQWFYQSRRLVRTCILVLIVLILGSAALDDCDFLGDKISGSNCTKNTNDMMQRRYIFCAIQCPLGFIWLLTTFTKFYNENLTWLPSIFIFTFGGFSLYATYLGETPDSAIYMCYLFIVWLFIRIPFWSAGVVTSVMFCIYVFVILYTQLYNAKKSVNDANTEEPTVYDTETTELLYLFVTNICLIFASHFWERSHRVEFLESKILEHIQKNSKNLLNQILPVAIQERVQKEFLTTGSDDESTSFRKPIADEANDVSVLFSDIKGFTKFCSSVQAMDVVRALNTLYMTFDHSLERLGVFKVETIGDAYFVSANCPIKKLDHAKSLVILGKEMIAACSRFRPSESKEYKFQMRIGIHSGKVFAGIVGRKMPRYHLFGQTVTIAECMESSGAPGKVQISEATVRYLEKWEEESKEKLNFSWKSRGEREVINNVTLETYFVEFNTKSNSMKRVYLD